MVRVNYNLDEIYYNLDEIPLVYIQTVSVGTNKDKAEINNKV